MRHRCANGEVGPAWCQKCAEVSAPGDRGFDRRSKPVASQNLKLAQGCRQVHKPGIMPDYVRDKGALMEQAELC